MRNRVSSLRHLRVTTLTYTTLLYPNSLPKGTFGNVLVEIHSIGLVSKENYRVIGKGGVRVKRNIDLHDRNNSLKTPNKKTKIKVQKFGKNTNKNHFDTEI